jgi:ATP-dependent exoDNAse (exonuclease V) beta subunit
MPKISDNAERLRVLNELGSTLLVEAGAGTGKTALMAGRVAFLLADGVPPKEIAAITFTEAAASELLARIAGYVRDLCEERIPQELLIALPEGPSKRQVENLQLALKSFDEMICSTIHSFCQQLTSPYPVEAMLDPGATIMDEVQANLAHDQLFEEWLRDQLKNLESDNIVAVVLLERGTDGRNLLAQIIAAQQEHRSAKAPESPLTDPLVTQFRDAIESFFKIVRRASQQGLNEDKTSGYAEEFEQLSKFYSGTIQPDISFRELWRLSNPPRIGAFKRDGYELRKYQCKGAWQEAAVTAGQPKALGIQFNNEITAAYASVGQTLTALLDALGLTILSQLTRELENFGAAFQKHKQSSALLDFDDLIYHARDLLRNSPGIRSVLSNRYRHVLVDEFQDTDPLQAEILFLLCGDGHEDAPWHERLLRPGQLFIVGDPKQSIYRFRRADISCYNKVRKAFLDQCPGSKVEITANFRSQQDILEYVNERFASQFREIGFAPLTCTLEGERPTDSRVIRIAVEYAQETRVVDARHTEAEQVALFCRGLLDSFQVRTNRGVQPCRPNHIALLAPSGTELWIYESALERLGIPLSTQAGKRLFLRQEIQDLVAITRILSNRRDTFALGAFLRGPLVGLSEEALLDIVEALPRDSESGQYSRLRVTTNPELILHPVARETLRVLHSLSKKAYNTTPFDILCAAIEQLRVRPLLLQRHPTYPSRTISGNNVSAATGSAQLTFQTALAISPAKAINAR